MPYSHTSSGKIGCITQRLDQYSSTATGCEFEMAAINSDPSCFELSDDGTNESVSSAADHGPVLSLLTQLKQAPVAAANINYNYKHYKIKHY